MVSTRFRDPQALISTLALLETLQPNPPISVALDVLHPHYVLELSWTDTSSAADVGGSVHKTM